MNPPGVVLILFDLPHKVLGLLLALLHLAEDAIEVRGNLIYPTLLQSLLILQTCDLVY